MIYIQRLPLFLFVLLGTATFAQAQEPVPHPRLLMLSDEDYRVPPETLFARADSIIVAFSDAVLAEPPVTRTFIGRRLLGTSREALKRIFWLSYTYRIHGGETYARKAIDEMLAVSAFKDWNPAHFLDVAEMTMVVAIGYDWLYDQMTPRERKKVAQAILDKGLKPALNEADAWFYNSEINWNSVCNAGMVYGAVAVWEEDPDFCRSMVEKSLESNKLAYKAYEGGGYPEGYNYWGYGASFQIMLEEVRKIALYLSERWPVAAGHDENKVAASHDENGVAAGHNENGVAAGHDENKVAAGHDNQAPVMPPDTLVSVMPPDTLVSVMPDLIGHPSDGFLASSKFIRFTSTPAGNCFSFSDSYRKASGQYMQTWMINRVGDRSIVYPEMRIMEMTGYKRLCEERLFPMYLISVFHSGPNTPAGMPDDHYFQCGGTTPIFVYRSGWAAEEDDYLGVKGGLTMSSHSHCDQGSFYFESDGVAWATDLGMQDYNSLESAGVDLWDMTQDSERWEVFRIGPFSHNIVTVNGHTPKVNHPVALSHTWKPEHPSWKERLGAVVDLTDLYTEDLDSCKRAVYLLGTDLHILDVLQAGDSTCTVRWAMCTEAQASLQEWSDYNVYGPVLRLQNGWHRRELWADFLRIDWTQRGQRAFRLDRDDYRFPGVGAFDEGGGPELTPHIWPTTYDPAAPDVDGMQYLHPTDAPNPGTSLVGYTFTLQPHQKVVLHVLLSRIL